MITLAVLDLVTNRPCVVLSLYHGKEACEVQRLHGTSLIELHTILLHALECWSLCLAWLIVTPRAALETFGMHYDSRVFVL